MNEEMFDIFMKWVEYVEFEEGTPIKDYFHDFEGAYDNFIAWKESEGY